MLRILESGGNAFSEVESLFVGSVLIFCDDADGISSMTVPLKHVGGRVLSRRLGSCT